MPVESATFLSESGRLWELTTWQPGRADFYRFPTPARLRAAGAALARLHQTWAGAHTAQGPCPAVQRRRRAAVAWLSLVSGGWRPRFRPGEEDLVRPWAERAWSLAAAWVPQVAALLAPWADRHFALHPCLCDIWHDHVLFEGDAVSGIVDYGSVKVDHAAVDVARLLGSLAPDDHAGWETALAAYTAIRPLTGDERALAHVLDRTGTILGAVNWLKWLYHDGRTFDDYPLAAARLEALVHRMASWRSG